MKRKQDARVDDQQIDADRSQSEREQRGADATEPHAQRDDEREWRQRKLRSAGAGKEDSGPRRDRDPCRRDGVRRHAPQEPAESRGLVHRSLAGHVGENGLARQITTTAMMMLTREPRNMAQELCCPSLQPLSTAQSCQPNAVFACSAGDATHDSSRFSPAARGTPLAAVAAMDATCAGCGRTIPDFSRVCEHCGHGSAEQLLLPTLATSLQGDPEPNTATNGFDFTPDPADFAPESFDFPTSSDPGSLDAGDFEPLEDSIFRFEAERRRRGGFSSGFTRIFVR